MSNNEGPGLWSVGLGLGHSDYDSIFVSLHSKVNDIFIQTDQKIKARYKGRIVAVTDEPLSKLMVSELLDWLAGPNRAAKIKKGDPDGWTHRSTIVVGMDTDFDPGVVLRFRCNARSVTALRTADGIHLSMRPIEKEPRDLQELGLPDRLREGLFPDNGFVLFSGPTGSGKTTTMAAVMRTHCFDPRGRVIATTEDPVEHNLHVLEGTTGVIIHAELGRNVNRLADSIRANLRENPNVMLVGEMRDEETMMLSLEGSQTGHSLYSTIHCNSVTNIFGRVAQKIQSAKPEDVCAAFIQTSRCFVYQRLFQGIKGRKVLVLEYVVLTGEDRAALSSELTRGGISAVSLKMSDILKTSGVSFVESAQEALKRGDFSQEQYEEIVYDFELEARIERGEVLGG